MVDPGTALVLGLGVIVLGGILFWPRRGLLPRWGAMRRMTGRIMREDVLKHIQKMVIAGRTPTFRSVAGALEVSTDKAATILADLEARQLVYLEEGVWRLSAVGEGMALHTIRGHRLWERFLAEETGFAESEWHSQAEALEHTFSAAELDALARTLGNPSHDPHGDPIPTLGGQLLREEGVPLTKLDVNQAARVVHIPDEPETVAAQLRAEGLLPGMVLRISENTPQRIRFWIGKEEHLLAPVVAADSAVVPVTPKIWVQETLGEPLTVLSQGEGGEVVELSPLCRGPERRRLMDLGVLPGTRIEAELVSPGGDPTAYRIRDALIALRREQAQWIKIKRITTENTNAK